MKQESLPHEKSLKIKTETKDFTTDMYGSINLGDKTILSAKLTNIDNNRLEIFYKMNNNNSYTATYTTFSSGTGTTTRLTGNTTYNIKYTYLIEE